MKPLRYLVRIVIHPRSTSRAILEENTLHPSIAVVLGFSALVSILLMITYLLKQYPPPADEMKLWIEAWGEFAMLPFLRVDMERYRLAEAVFFTPLVLAVWILMAGSARILSALFGGRVTFDQYLNLFGFSFFAFWILAHILDAVYSLACGSFVIKALKLEYGPIVRQLFVVFPSAMWPLVLAAGGVYNGIAVRESEGFSFLKTALVAAATAMWPIAFVAFFLR